MYLKKIWNKLGVSNKLFFTSLILVILSTVVVYTALYGLFPKAYSFYKSEVVTNGAAEILGDYKHNTSNTELFEALNKFSYNNNVDLLIKDDSGIEYISSRFFERYIDDSFTKSEEARIEKKFNSEGIVDRIDFYSKASSKKMTLEVRIPMEPVTQISRVMLIFLPIVIAITIAITLVSSYLYSKAVTKPLLKINDIAKAMAKLDFSKKLEIEGDDELSELAFSLNEMSSSLERNINELETFNKKLISDIEKERIQEKKRREFIGTISHELKSPITIVSGQLEGMIYNIGAFKDRDKYLLKSYDVMQEMKELVGEILELNKYESEAFKVQMEKVDFTAMLEAAIDKKAYYKDELSIEIESNINKKVYIYADTGLIKKVVDNIISNAMKYLSDDNKIFVNLRTEDDKVLFEVLNKSHEITSEELDKIFTPFYRMEKSRNRKTGGSGLGLYIVKNIITKHSNMQYNMAYKDGIVKFKLEIEV